MLKQSRAEAQIRNYSIYRLRGVYQTLLNIGHIHNLKVGPVLEAVDDILEELGAEREHVRRKKVGVSNHDRE